MKTSDWVGSITAVVLVSVAVLIVGGNEQYHKGYKHGQLDALKGQYKYKLEITHDTTAVKTP